MQKTEIPYSCSHACLPCDLLCAHIAALRSKKSVSISPCGKCTVNLGRLRYRLLTAWSFCFQTSLPIRNIGDWQYMLRKHPTPNNTTRIHDKNKKKTHKKLCFFMRPFHIPLLFNSFKHYPLSL